MSKLISYTSTTTSNIIFYYIQLNNNILYYIFEAYTIPVPIFNTRTHTCQPQRLLVSVKTRPTESKYEIRYLEAFRNSQPTHSVFVHIWRARNIKEKLYTERRRVSPSGPDRYCGVDNPLIRYSGLVSGPHYRISRKVLTLLRFRAIRHNATALPTPFCFISLYASENLIKRPTLP